MDCRKGIYYSLFFCLPFVTLCIKNSSIFLELFVALYFLFYWAGWLRDCFSVTGNCFDTIVSAGKTIKKIHSLADSFFFNAIASFVDSLQSIGSDLGQLWGRLFSPSLSDYLMNLAKVFGRSFLPPSDNSYFLSIAFVLILVVVITALYKLLKNTKEHFVFYQLTVALALSYIIPVMFGVSTHTFEGDRLLYFSSFFLTLLMAFCLSLVKSRIIKYSVLSLIMVYFVIFLFRNNASWIKAGQITTYLINKIKTDRKPDSQIGIIDLPQEYNGAFIFRNGFKVALYEQSISYK